MWNKKSIKFIKLVLSAMIVFGFTKGTASFAQATPGATAGNAYGKNGVAYVLLNSEFSTPGIYRFNNYDASITNPWRLYSLNNMAGKKASGLAANQNNKVFLLTTNSGGSFADAPVGWLPTGIKFDENSPIYLAVAGPSDGGATDYHRAGYPGHHAWPINGNPNSGQYWKRDQTYEGKAFEYAVNFGGPVGVKFLNGTSGTVGTPVWDGTFWPNSLSNARAIPHPNFSSNRKIILPSHVGALSYYLYGTKNEPAIEGLVMDGSDGRDTYIFTAANGAGYFSGDNEHRPGTMFGCIVKRIYQKRTNSLDLYSANDQTSATVHPINGLMSQTQSNVLQTVDVKVRESYGKLCGDNCIDGGEIEGNKPIETALSTVTVVTSTVGNRYGFNPLGTPQGAVSTDAALRVVSPTGITRTIDISTAPDGQYFSDNITNRAYLTSKNITPNAIKTIGVSSNFSTASNNDYIYGSAADHFVVQDSWWGKGGVAYEYYKGNESTAGSIIKLNYTNNVNPTAEPLGDLTGKVDSIAIDGDGYLYALKTEENPTDAEMERIEADINSLAIDSTSYTQTPNLPTLGNDFAITLSGWRRDQTTTTSDSEVINDSYIDIPEGQQKPGDYKIAYLKQSVYKSVKRYPQGTGSLGTEDPRGSLFAGYDTWINKYKKTATGVQWDYPIWRQEEGTKTSSLLAELAVVNVADSPITVPGTQIHHVITSSNPFGQDNEVYNNGTPISEQGELYFKVEGYKPVVGGQQRDLRDIGDIGNNIYKDVKLNSIPAQDGTYAHDENGDGKTSGFPSNMFEAKGFDTTVIWKIAQVENTTAVSLTSPDIKLVSSINNQNPTENKYKSLKYKFNQPGRYIIQAVVTYNYFNNFGQAQRPTDLTVAQETFTTEPILISVYANALNLNESPSYITNIKLESSNQYNAAPSASNFDVLEGSDPHSFGNLTISFDAQFFREEQNNTTGDLQTYDGIGVWDYNYYKQLYENALTSSGIAIATPTVSTSNHAYNYVDGQSVDTSYNPNIYNPGKLKASSVGMSDYTAGTKVNGHPSATDMQFIQWALYLRPITPQEDINPNTPPMFSRGDLIKAGTFAGVELNNNNETSPGSRKYSVSMTIGNIDNLINTPRDPKDYTLDLEIIYPRVTWLNNDLGAGLGDNNQYFSSVIPYREGVAPIHVLSKLNINSSDKSINQSYEDNATDLTIFKNDPEITLCVRDNETPTFKDETAGLPLLETTGDPRLRGSFSYTIEDNNPFLATDNVTPTTAMTVNTAVNHQKINLQNLIDGATFSDEKENKKFEHRSDVSLTTPVISYANTPAFYKDDAWKLKIDYNTNLTILSPSRFEPNINPIDIFNKLENSELPAQITMDNWVGTLNYAIGGQFYDGIGRDSDHLIHKLYDKNAANINPSDDYALLTQNEENSSIPAPMKQYLTRIDNDPPHIQVELVSQNDNRRWVFRLLEGVNDSVANPTSVAQLQPSILSILSTALSGSGVNSNWITNNQIPGTTNQYSFTDSNNPNPSPQGALGTEIIKTTDVFSDAIPSFRRASRLIVNVYIFDNCGYKPLSEANITIKNGSETLLPQTDIKCAASHNIHGKIEDDFKKPRGTYAVDMPMKLPANLVEVTVYAKDHAGNARGLIIPVRIVDSSFETRILETKENRR